jgi:hypothetical protein
MYRGLEPNCKCICKWVWALLQTASSPKSYAGA